MLTIKKTKTIINEWDEPIELPTHWGMFTASGNRSITQKAKRFMEAVDGERDYLKRTEAALKFLRSFRKMSSCKTYGEADDTAVRESVGCFFDGVCEAVGLDGDTLWYAEN